MIGGWRTSGDMYRDRGGRVAGYTTLAGFSGLGFKIAGDKFARFGPHQNSTKDLRVARDIMRELTSRQNIFMKGSWSSGAHHLVHLSYFSAMEQYFPLTTWTIMSLGLSGLRKYQTTGLKMRNSS
jgi:hypothetical protein